MAIRFRLRDFALPAALFHYRRLFDRAQWWPADRIRDYQSARLRAVLSQAMATVPYYARSLRGTGLVPADIRSLDDLRGLPLLSKEDVRRYAADLTAVDAGRYRPQEVRSTGSTSLPVSVRLDRRTNAMEFAFYWRQWGWFGYRLGDRFAQLSWSEFFGARESSIAHEEFATGRMLLNVNYLTAARVAQFASAMRAHRTRFLKGHPSALLHLALFVRDARLEMPPLRAVFSTGEVLEPATRGVISDVLQAPVANAYGQMERVVAACECPHGRMHVNPDYGAWEVVDQTIDPGSGRRVGRIVGTSLHNYSMPLVRYDTGDVVEADGPEGPCPCGRTFPTVGRLHGRSVDAVVAPDGRIVTAAAVVFNDARRILQGQLVQHELHRLSIRVLPAPGFGPDDVAAIERDVRRLVGESISIAVERVERMEDFGPPGTKHRPVISTVSQRAIAKGAPLP